MYSICPNVWYEKMQVYNRVQNGWATWWTGAYLCIHQGAVWGTDVKNGYVKSLITSRDWVSMLMLNPCQINVLQLVVAGIPWGVPKAFVQATTCKSIHQNIQTHRIHIQCMYVDICAHIQRLVPGSSRYAYCRDAAYGAAGAAMAAPLFTIQHLEPGTRYIAN